MRRAAHILVVDDDADNRDTLAILLGELGYFVSRASGGAEALQYIGSGQPCHAVVSDVMMPEMSGLEFASRTRAQWPTLPIVLLTGHTDGIDAALATGAIPLLKPVTSVLLRQVLDDALRAPRVAEG